MSYVPAEKTLVLDPGRKRLTAKNVAAVLRCIARDDQPKQIKITWRGPLVTLHNETYMKEVTAQGYNMVFLVQGSGGLGNCVAMVTPGGAEFNADSEEGLPNSLLSPEDHQSLAARIFFDPTETTITAVPGYRLVINVGKPDERSVDHFYERGIGEGGVMFPSRLRKLPGNFFTDKAEAEATAKELKKYMASVEAKTTKKGKK